MRELAFALALVMGLGLAQVARAQCAEGREISEDTAGRCCWPGQRWDDQDGRCEGPPRCPPGRFAEGDTCVAPSTTSGYVGAPSAGYGATSATLGAPSSGYMPPVPAQGQQSRLVRSPIEELVITGALITISAYSYSIIAGSLLLGSWVNGSPWLMYIPLAGGFIYPAFDSSSYGSSGTGDGFGIPGAALQTIGLILMIVGAAAKETSVVVPQRRWAASLEPEVVSGPGEAGVGLRWRF